MDPSEITGHLITAVVTLATAMAAVLRTVKHRTVSPDELQEALKRIRAQQEKIDSQQLLIAQLQEYRHNSEQMRREDNNRVLRHEELLRTVVTTEEFKAYTHQTTSSVNGLTERVGQLIGFVDANRR